MAGDDKGIMRTIGSFLHAINVFLFEKHKKPTAVIGAVLIIMLTVIVFELEADAKSSVIMYRDDIIRKAGTWTDGGGILDLDEVAGFEETELTLTGSGTLGEGNTEPFTIEADPERVIISIRVDIDWNDEDDIRRIRLYQNTPDEFSVSIIDPEGGMKVGTAKNPEGGSGSLSVSRDLTHEEVAQFLDMGDFTVEVTLVQSGDYEARLGIGLLKLTDDSNDYSFKITTTYLSPPVDE